MATTVFGLFDTAAAANAVKTDLTALGIPADDVKLESQGGTTSSSASTESSGDNKSFWEGIKEMFGGGDESHYADYYAEGTRRGGTMVSVNTTDELAEHAADVLRRHGAVDVDERASQWQKSGWQGHHAATGSAANTTAPLAAADLSTTSDIAATTDRATTADVGTNNLQGKKQTTNNPATLEIAEEQIEVGKRQVARGGVRVIRRVIETPVEQDVNLREERVNVERRAANRELTGAEANAAFADQTVELTETGEVAVAAKTAHVVGEVVVDKNVVERTEKVRDTVRKTDVQVERIPGQDAGPMSSSKASDIESTTTPGSKQIAADRD